jgi:hypothetical protein
MLKKLFYPGATCATALLLGGAFLWVVYTHASPQRGVAIIHVTETDVDIAIDGETKHITNWEDSPIIRRLRPGQHTVRMSRSDRTLFEETFTLTRADDVIVTAWDRTRVKPSQVATVSAQTWRPTDLDERGAVKKSPTYAPLKTAGKATVRGRGL